MDLEKKSAELQQNHNRKIVRGFLIWVFLYGFIVMNLGTQLIYFLVHYISYLLCSENCSIGWDLYARNLPQRLIFSSILAPLVFSAVWGIWYWRVGKIV